MNLKNLNFDKFTLEELAKLQKDVAIRLEKRVAQEVKQSSERAEQLQNLAQNILGNSGTKIPRKAKKPKGETTGGSLAVEEEPKEPVFYRHPADDSLVWEGPTGRKPQWLRDLLKKEGWKLEDLKVPAEKAAEEPPKVEETKEEPKPEEGSEEPKAPSVLHF